MKLVTIDSCPDGRAGVIVGKHILDFGRATAFVPLASWVPASMRTLLAAGTVGLDIIRRIVDDVNGRSADEHAAMRACAALIPYDEHALLPPVMPGVLLSHGRAYLSHRKEMRGDLYDPAAEEPPSAFLKNLNSIVATRKPIRLPADAAEMIDLEVEFSIVFGRTCHKVSADEALQYVAGYTLINDVSARDWAANFNLTKNPDLNRMGKQFPTFTPLGPVIVTADEIPDPNNVNLGSSINGTIMQQANTSDLIYRIEYLISYFSRWYEFRPGDVLTTGSPAGNGFGRKPPIFIKPGDTISVYADHVGALTNPVVLLPSRP